MRIPRRLPRWADAILLLALCVYLVAGVPVVPFHGDESTLVFMSRDYSYQFLQRDLSLVTYQQPPVSQIEQLLRIINGTVGKYTIGLAWHLAGFTVDDLNGDWVWDDGYEANIAHQSRSAPALLTVARLPSALFTCLAVLALFALSHAVGGRGAAWSATILFALNPIVLMNGRRAMMEGSMMAFTFLTVLSAVWVVRAEREISAHSHARRRLWKLFAWLVLSLFAGLAAASKHTTLLTVGAVSLSILLIALPAPTGRRRIFWGSAAVLMIKLALMGALAFGVFYALNPAWWGDPFTRVIEVAKQRSYLMSVQTATATVYPDRAAQLAGFFEFTFGGQPQYFEAPGWAQSIGGEISRYEASGLAGVIVPGLLPAVLFAALTVLGGFVLLAAHPIPSETSSSVRMLPPDRARVVRACNVRARILVLIWAVAMLCSSWLLTPVLWQRYYLPAIMGGCLLAGIGADTALRLGIGVVRGRRRG